MNEGYVPRESATMYSKVWRLAVPLVIATVYLEGRHLGYSQVDTTVCTALTALVMFFSWLLLPSLQKRGEMIRLLLCSSWMKVIIATLQVAFLVGALASYFLLLWKLR